MVLLPRLIEHFDHGNIRAVPFARKDHESNKDCSGEIQSGPATCSEGIVTCFLKFPLACLSSMAVAVQPNSLGELWEIILQNLRNKLRSQTVGEAESGPIFEAFVFLCPPAKY